MDDENPYTGVGKMNICNYFFNIALLGGLAGEEIWSGNVFKWDLWLVSEQKSIRTMKMSLEKQQLEKFKIAEIVFNRLPYGYEGIDILRYYHASIYRPYVLKIRYLGEKIILR